MANKPTRKKFRPPLKANVDSSLPCSQASSKAGASQEISGREGSQSWLSQLTAVGSGVTKEASYTVFSSRSPSGQQTTVQPEFKVATPLTKSCLDDSLCSLDVDQHGAGFHEEGLISRDKEISAQQQQSPSQHSRQQETTTETHTVLSYCSEENNASDSSACADIGLQEKSTAVVAVQDKFKIFEFPDSGTSTVDCSNINDMNGCADNKNEGIISICTTKIETDELLANLFSESSDEEGDMDCLAQRSSPSRFQRRNKTQVAHRYDYSNILPRIGTRRTALRKKVNKVRKKKSVSLILHHQSRVSSTSRHVAGFGDKEMAAAETSKGDLSVYDYQLTPQQQEGDDGGLAGVEEYSTDLNNSNWISKRTREEQVSKVFSYCQ